MSEEIEGFDESMFSIRFFGKYCSYHCDMMRENKSSNWAQYPKRCKMFNCNILADFSDFGRLKRSNGCIEFFGVYYSDSIYQQRKHFVEEL